MFGQVQTIIGNVSSSAGYPAKLFPMEVQVAFYRHNPTTRTSPATAAIGSLLLVSLLGGLCGLAGEQLHDGSVSGLDELGRILGGLAGTPVNLLKDLGELASNVGSVAVEHWGVAVGHLAGVVQHDDLGGE